MDLYHVRPARRADIAGLQDIERAASVLFPPGRLPDPDDVMPLADLENAAEEGLLLVAVGQDDVVGFAMSRTYGDLLHLAILAVHPDHGRRGVGAMLVRAVIEQARRRGLCGVILTTFRDVPFNGPFYRKLGFRFLSGVELSPMLRDVLVHEEHMGLTDRVAMMHACSLEGTGRCADGVPDRGSF